MKGKISPSMMCASIHQLDDILHTFENKEIEFLHIDIMDGVFVPNIMLCNDIAKQYREVCHIPHDYHLMIVEPLNKLDWFDIKQGDMVSIHYESTKDVVPCLMKIKDLGGKAGLAIKPATPLYILKEYLEYLDFVLVMTVNPGFAGQKLLPETLEKIKECRDYLDNLGHEEIFIEVDGNVSFGNAKLMREKGADIFVAGTSSIFKKDLSLDEGIDELRKAIE